MGEMLPLFPLGAVLYPGMLHAAAPEGRYRQLVWDPLAAGPEPRRFSVIAIRSGPRDRRRRRCARCTRSAAPRPLRQAGRRDEGRFDIVIRSAPSGSGCSGGSTRRGRTCRGRSSAARPAGSAADPAADHGLRRAATGPGGVPRVPGRADRMGRRYRAGSSSRLTSRQSCCPLIVAAASRSSTCATPAALPGESDTVRRFSTAERAWPAIGGRHAAHHRLAAGSGTPRNTPYNLD